MLLPGVPEAGVGGDYDVPQVGRLVLPLHLGDVAHHHIHKGVLDQAQKHKHRTRRHENIDRLKIKKKPKY